jgi:hypothetical protein
VRISNIEYELQKLEASREELLNELAAMQTSRDVLFKKILESKKDNKDEQTLSLLKELTSKEERKSRETGPSRMKSIAAYYTGTEMDRFMNDLLDFMNSSEYLIEELLRVASKFGYFNESQPIIRNQPTSQMRLILLYFLYSFKEDFVLYLMEKEEENND